VSLVDLSNLNKELELSGNAEMCIKRIKWNIEKVTNPKQRHDIIGDIEDVISYLSQVKNCILEDLRVYGLGVKLLEDQSLPIASSWPGIIEHYKKKYKKLIVKSYGDWIGDKFRIPKGTLGIITSVYAAQNDLRYNVGIPDPVTNKLNHGSVLKFLKLNSFTTGLTEDEKKILSVIQTDLVLKREDGNLKALTKLGELNK